MSGGRCQEVGGSWQKMETAIICWGYAGIMENKMESTIVY